MPETLPLVLLPGMGADRRLFQAQQGALENLILANWLPHEPGETLAGYARRMARAYDPGGPCLIGGVSMGGMVAREMTAHLDARACLLISSIRSPDELPRRWRVFRRAIRMVPPVCGGLPIRGAKAVLALGKGRLRLLRRALLEQFVEVDGRFLHWCVQAVLCWELSPNLPDVPIAQIHGDRDRMLPHRLTQPDVIVPGAGHLLVVTYPKVVTDFLRAQVEKYGRSSRRSR